MAEGAYEALGKGFARAYDIYQNKPRVNAAVNTVGVYLGGKIASEIAGAVSPGLEAIVDLATPIAASMYATSRINQDRVISNNHPILKQVAATMMWSLTGWDMGRILNHHDLGWMQWLGDSYSATAAYLNEKYRVGTNIIGEEKNPHIGPRKLGAFLGFTAYAIKSIVPFFKKYYAELQQNRSTQ
jgi:hypothetical protein